MLSDDDRRFLESHYQHHPESPGNPNRIRGPASPEALAVLRQLHEHNQRWNSVRGLELTRTRGDLVSALVDHDLVIRDHTTATWLSLTAAGRDLLATEEPHA